MAKLKKAKKKIASKGNAGVMSLTDQAYEAIKEKVITLYFLPGQYLNEAAICDLLDLGRTPVHQALQRLQLEGLIDVVPRKGVIIQPDSISQILEFLDARMVVEAELARSAATHATADDIRDLQSILDAHSEGSHAGNEINAFVECDHAFHTKMHQISRSRVLGDFAKTLHERCTRSWYLHLWQTLDTDASDKQHRKILKAIKAHDADGAAKALRDHLTSLRERVALLQNSPVRNFLHLERPNPGLSKQKQAS